VETPKKSNHRKLIKNAEGTVAGKQLFVVLKARRSWGQMRFQTAPDTPGAQVDSGYGGNETR
jgi:hypothetical protein